jgi:SAM-dependent methyltransferase
MGFLSVLSQAQRIVAERTVAGDIAIDATAGNGVDTLFLARTVGPGGHVYAFDVQQEALAQTRARLDDAGAQAPLAPVTLIHAGHESLRERIDREHHGRISAVMFNLGYLPGGPPGVITKPHTTLPAMEAALDALRAGGVITAVVYPGHDGGREEADEVEKWAAGVSSAAAQTVVYRFPQKPAAPYLIALSKR